MVGQVFFGNCGGEDDRPRIAGLAQRLDHLQAAQARHHEVAHDELGLFLRFGAVRILAGVRAEALALRTPPFDAKRSHASERHRKGLHL
jgi:hypothetical protein